MLPRGPLQGSKHLQNDFQKPPNKFKSVFKTFQDTELLDQVNTTFEISIVRGHFTYLMPDPLIQSNNIKLADHSNYTNQWVVIANSFSWAGTLRGAVK